MGISPLFISTVYFDEIQSPVARQNQVKAVVVVSSVRVEIQVIAATQCQRVFEVT